MGLKKANYEVKRLGITVPEAYAVIREMSINGDYGIAQMAIQGSREYAFSKEPLETKTIYFKIDRNQNPYITAYEKAKERIVSTFVDPETGEERESVSEMPFASWEDDIIETEVE